MEKKLNFVITFLAIAAGSMFYYTWNGDSVSKKHLSKDVQEKDTPKSLADKVSIPKKEIHKASVSTEKSHPIKIHLTKENENKKFIEEDNITSIPIDKQQKHIAQVYSNLEPETYQEDLQEAEENFNELDSESKELSQNLQIETADIEQ